MRRIIHRTAETKTVMGIPMEKTRVLVHPAAINLCFKELSALLGGIPRDFGPNMDETGANNFTDVSDRSRDLPA
jgi:hypothetical protein